MRLSAYDTYNLYIGLKNHFSTYSYDFFKYKGKVRSTKESFSIRKDKYKFQKLSRLYPENEMLDFLVANLSQDSNKWVGDLIEDESSSVYKEYIKRKQAISHFFENELDNILKDVKRPNELFSGDFPSILTLYLQKEISLESMVILNDFIQYSKKFDDKLSTDFLWPKIKMRLIKIKPFIDYDKNKIKKILINKMKGE